MPDKLILVHALAVVGAGAIVAILFPSSFGPVLLLAGLVAVIGWVTGLVAMAKVRSGVGRIRQVAEAVHRGELTQRVEVTPGDDFARLGRSVNQLGERLEELSSAHDELRRQMSQRDHLALVGELAATVAHEINNPLDGLQNCARIARRNLDDPEKVRGLLDLMDTGLFRIETIVKRLLSLSRAPVAERTPTFLDDVVREAVLFIETKSARNQVDIVTELPEKRICVLVDCQQLVQVLINLMLNALEAMPDGGRLTVGVHQPHDHEGSLRISVSDTGVGMTPEQTRHVFEPFYTTKTGQGGTGLGLPVVARVVEAHNGQLRVSSVPGRGSTFTIELPWSAAPTRPLSPAGARTSDEFALAGES